MYNFMLRLMTKNTSELAKTVEYSQLPIMKERIEQWYRHNELKAKTHDPC